MMSLVGISLQPQPRNMGKTLYHVCYHLLEHHPSSFTFSLTEYDVLVI